MTGNEQPGGRLRVTETRKQCERNDRKPKCLGCGDFLPKPFLDLGRTPLANSFLKASTDCAGEQMFPLAVAYCETCHLVQLLDTVRPEKIFCEYAYFSTYSEGFLEHARIMAQALSDRLSLNSSSRILEIASNDGYLLRHFKQRGMEVLGVDPAQNIAAEANKQGIPTLCRFFNRDLAFDIVQGFGKADLIVGNNVLAHVPEINNFLLAVADCLKAEGAVVFEFPYVRELLDEVEFDTIYHEHVFYLSLSAIQILADRAGLELFEVIRQPVHGGSLRVFLQHPQARPVAGSVTRMLSEETRIGLTSGARYAALAPQASKLKYQLRSMLCEIKADGKRIAAYGAPAKGNTLLNFCGIGRDLLDFTVDRSPHKQGRLLPGSHLPILPPEELLARMPEFTVILPWNIAREIIEQQKAYLQRGGRFIVPVPRPRVVESAAD
jgi:SAM-dependent methyltransferase